MNISDIPETLADLKEWGRDFENTHMVFSKTNYQVAAHTLEFVLNRVTRIFGLRVRAFVRELAICLLDERTQVAFDLPQPSRAARSTLRSAMSTFAFVHRYLSLPRIWPHEYTTAVVPYHILTEAAKKGTLPRQHPSE